MVNENGRQAIECQSDGVLNTTGFARLEMTTDLQAWLQVPEVTIDSQDENGEI